MNITTRRPTFSDDGWVRASRCGPSGNNCVELNHGDHGDHGVVGVRDSKSGGGEILIFSSREWIGFLARGSR
ncbi:MAG: DUF397 domain-containing protein [Actinophytocola sp.]|uniref:DUF397 domain-containing protein n=1 Tax=Actinophytocola sp. TaxID=1872138 RepID=UPI0013254334|nr:DUF397 domain-containing protein [Actinophytocola sp.]MPZ84032.1 DUF397 domain-containing protein [Actinophytocola sp.]